MADPFSFAIATVAQIGVSYLFPSEGPRIKDLKVSASTYGASIPWVFGLCRVAGNMIWSTTIKENKKKKWAGKGGYYNQYTYTCTFAMGLCKGPIKGILRIWADSKLIYDITGGQSGGDLKSLMNAALTGNNTALNKYKMRFYTGEEDQVPDSAIIADKGEENTPAYRGLAYIVFDDFSLTDFGNRVPQITAEVYLGETEESVQIVDFKQADGSTALATDYASGEACFDWDRNYAHIRYADTITQIDLKTSKVLQSFDSTNFRFSDSANLAHLLTTGNDGALYVTYGAEASYMPVAKLDPYSMQQLLTFGSTDDNTGSANTDIGFVAPVAASTALSDQSVEYLCTLGSNGQVGVLRCDTMVYQWGADFYLGGSASLGMDYRLVGADADSSSYPVFYAVWGNSAGFKVTKLSGDIFSGGSQSDVWTISGSSIVLGSAMWDSAVPGILLFWTEGSTHYLSKWSLDTGDEAWRITVTGYPTNFSEQSRIISGKFAWVYAGVMYLIDTATGNSLDDQVDPNTGDVIEGDGSGYNLPSGYASETPNLQAVDSTRSLLNCFDGIDGTVFINFTTIGMTVGAIVDRLLQEGDLDRTQYDLTAINSIAVKGYGWASSSDVKSIIDELQRIYLFDMVERDGILVAIKRGEITDDVNVSATLPQDVLGSSSDSVRDFWTETRAQEADIPAIVMLTYMNYDDDYQSSTARSQRLSNPYPTMYSRQQLSMQANVVMSPSEAKAQVKKILYSQWSERVTHTTRLPWAYLHLDPGDFITVDMNDGRSYNDRMESMELGADFTIAASSYSQDSGSYDGWDGITSDGGGSGSQTLPSPTVALPFIINTPLLRDDDDTGGSASRYYAGLGNGGSGTFGGGGIYRSVNNVDYDLLTASSNDVEWGTIIGTVDEPSHGDFALDWETEIVVLPSVSWFDLQSITDDELWNGANICLVGDEIIQFRDCVENADGTWTLTNLLRGRRGSEYACRTHASGERFIFLSTSTINLAADVTNARGLTRYFKGVGAGRSIGESPVSQIKYEPRDLMPYAVANIFRSLPSTGTDIELTWARRNRIGGNLIDGTGEIALSEAYERYEVYILDSAFNGDLSRGDAPTTYRRMYTVPTPFCSYGGDEQAADGFDFLTDTLHVAIYQLSDTVGRGFPSVRSIAPDSEM